MIIQIKVGFIGNICYIIWDKQTKEAAVIDPGFDGEKISSLIKNHGLRLKYIFLTHSHFDHVSAIPELKFTGKNKFGNNEFKVIMHEKEENSKLADIQTKEGDVFYLGKKKIEVIETPGHTKGSVCYLFDNKYLFTGDTMFSNGAYGRTDLSGGSEKDMKESLKKLMKLNEKIKVYPGHDYSNFAESNIKREKEFYNF